MTATTADRVPANTAEEINRKIEQETATRVRFFADHPERIGRRLRALDEEWDIERVLQANAASLTVLGTVFGILRSRRWLMLPALVGGFLLQHALERGGARPFRSCGALDTARRGRSRRSALP